jgi:DNA-binding NtrC family response regulator
MAATPFPSNPPLVPSRSPQMQIIFEFLRIVRSSNSTVLITGESGTGKTEIARLIHESSGRRDRPFVVVGFTLSSDAQIESELFGRPRNAAGDQSRARPGAFERAEGGTLFLDGIDDLPASTQAKLLRVLDTHAIDRDGAAAVPVDVRLIAAARRDMSRMAEQGTFNDDLYRRLSVLRINVPPLRDRREDIEPLMRHFLERHCRRRGQRVPAATAGVKQAFLSYGWPGNIPELENVCERVAQTCTCGALRSGCVAGSILMPPRSPRARAHTKTRHSERPVPISLDDRIRQLETALIGAALTTTGGNKSRAAALLQIKRSTLLDRISRCKLAQNG